MEAGKTVSSGTIGGTDSYARRTAAMTASVYALDDGSQPVCHHRRVTGPSEPASNEASEQFRSLVQR